MAGLYIVRPMVSDERTKFARIPYFDGFPGARRLESRRMTTFARPERRLLVAVDIERYGHQDNLLQFETQQRFQAVMAEAARELGLDRARWVMQQGGDGELAVLPVDVSEPAVVAHLAPTIDRLLRETNRDLPSAARVRMRIAVHGGLVHLDGASGFPGEAVVTVARLVNAPPLKRALTMFPAAATAQIVSQQVYDDIVRHRYEGIRPDRYARFPVDLPDKDFHEPAWITVPGEDARTMIDVDPLPEEKTPPKSTGSTFSFGTFTANGPVSIGDYSQSSYTTVERPVPGEDR